MGDNMYEPSGPDTMTDATQADELAVLEALYGPMNAEGIFGSDAE